jgi:hypothetical protein
LLTIPSMNCGVTCESRDGYVATQIAKLESLSRSQRYVSPVQEGHR